MNTPIGIVGFRGYSGAEAVRILAAHPQLRVIARVGGSAERTERRIVAASQPAALRDRSLGAGERRPYGPIERMRGTGARTATAMARHV